MLPPMLSLLTRKKRFGDPWIGHPSLNRRHRLHAKRMQLADGFCRWRQQLIPAAGKDAPPGALERLQRDGFLEIRNFLPQTDFEALRQEVEQAVEQATLTKPLGRNRREGYQRKQPFKGGFDRFDGGTLNRFLSIEPASMPEATRFSHHSQLSAFSRAAIGLPIDPGRLDVYLTVQGHESRTPDLQKVLHRDTFFRAIKFWFFLRPVHENDGPFVYVPGSHKLDVKRLQWEQATANAAIASRAMPNVGGSFRIQEHDLAALGLPDPVTLACPANTLVLADVLGFHRRGDAIPGRQRLSLYGWNRPYPFLPVPW